VPNLTFGAPVVQALRAHTKGFLDCHLMVSNPAQWVGDFKKAGANQFTFHIEATEDVDGLVRKVHDAGMLCGVAIKPKTSAGEAIARLSTASSLLNTILVMTVEPGFGGQSFMSDMMPKVRAFRQRFPHLNIEVDGGLALDTIDQAAEAGANAIVAGTAIFKSQDPGRTIQELRQAVEKHSK